MSKNELRMKMNNGKLIFATHDMEYEISKEMKSVLLAVLLEDKLDDTSTMIIKDRKGNDLFMISSLKEN